MILRKHLERFYRIKGLVPCCVIEFYGTISRVLAIFALDKLNFSVSRISAFAQCDTLLCKNVTIIQYIFAKLAASLAVVSYHCVCMTAT